MMIDLVKKAQTSEPVAQKKTLKLSAQPNSSPSPSLKKSDGKLKLEF